MEIGKESGGHLTSWKIGYYRDNGERILIFETSGGRVFTFAITDSAALELAEALITPTGEPQGKRQH